MKHCLNQLFHSILTSIVKTLVGKLITVNNSGTINESCTIMIEYGKQSVVVKATDLVLNTN